SSLVLRRLGPAGNSPPAPPSPTEPWHWRHPALSHAASPAASRAASCAKADVQSAIPTVKRRIVADIANGACTFASLREPSAWSGASGVIRAPLGAVHIKPGLEPFDLGEKGALVAYRCEAKHRRHQLTEGVLPAGIRERLGSQNGLYRDGEHKQRYDDGAFEHKARPAGLAQMEEAHGCEDGPKDGIFVVGGGWPSERKGGELRKLAVERDDEDAGQANKQILHETSPARKDTRQDGPDRDPG